MKSITTPIPSKSRLIAARRTIALWLFGGKFGSKITLSAKKWLIGLIKVSIHIQTGYSYGWLCKPLFKKVIIIFY